MGGAVRVEGADEFGVRDVVRPVDPQGLRRPPEPADRAVGGVGQGPQDARAGGQHQFGRGHAGHQGDLRVPAVRRERGAVGKFVRAVAFDDLLIGHVERDAAALLFQGLAEPADVRQERHGLLRRAGVDGLLDAVVVESGPAADQGAADVDGLDPAVGVQVEAPQQRGAGPVGQQAGRPLREHGRVQRDPPVGEVEGRDAAVCLRVERAAGRHEGGDIGDGVVDPVAAGGPLRQVYGLVQVDGRRRVDGEEGDVGAVRVRQAGVRGRVLGLREDRRRELRGHLQLRPQFTQCGPQSSPVCAGHVHLTAWHGSSVWAAGPDGTASRLPWPGGRIPCAVSY